MPPPSRIETERLVLRSWKESDAPLLKEAVDSSLAHLRAWLPWAVAAPFDLEKTREQVSRFAARFEAEEEFVYGVFNRDESRVIGGTGLHTRVGPDALEIGYWVRVDETRGGFATELTRALTEVGLRTDGVDRIEIHCDPGNIYSRRVPQGLGFELIEVRDDDLEGGRQTMVFQMTSALWQRLSEEAS